MGRPFIERFDSDTTVLTCWGCDADRVDLVDVMRKVYTPYGRAYMCSPNTRVLNVETSDEGGQATLYSDQDIYDPESPLRSNVTYEALKVRCRHCQALSGWLNTGRVHRFYVILANMEANGAMA